MIINPSNISAVIKLAFSYTPKLLDHSVKRLRTGILYIVSGEYLYTWEGSSFLARSGDLIYLPTYSVPYNYRIKPVGDEPVQAMQVELELNDIYSGKPIVFSNCPVLISEHDNSLVRDCFERIISCQGKKDSVSQFLIHSELYKLLAICIKCTDDNQLVFSHRVIAPALNYIHENYRREFSVSDLAELCHISESQLRRKFIKVTGKSPIKYKNELILNDAYRFLSDGEIGIGTIANILGFCDSFAFSHFFKKMTGFSASTYKTNAAKQKLNS